MVSIRRERTIAAPPSQVFAWMNDSSNYTAAPMTLRERRTKDGDGAPYGVGAVREVTGLGAWFREVITAYDAPNSFSYLIVKSVPPFKHHGGTVLVTPTTDGGSHILWTTAYDYPVPGVGKALERITEPLVRRGFDQILTACDKALSG